MVGLVIVSHSAPLAAGVVELAREMGGADVAIEPAGGMTDGSIGTDAVAVADAIGRADQGDGVLVLMDLGSAVMSAELAVEMTEGAFTHVRLCAAPLVEGAIAAATAARLGRPLEEVATEAMAGLAPKQAHLGENYTEVAVLPPPIVEGRQELRLKVPNRLGLHARPAARFVQTAARFEAAVTVTNETTGRGPVRADSLTAVATLGALMGHYLVIGASGSDAEVALAALRELAEDDFGDREVEPRPVADLPTPGGRAEGKLGGIPAGAGIAIGALWWLERPAVEVARERATDPDDHWERLVAARRRARDDVAAARQRAARSGDTEAASILEAHEVLLADQALTGPARTGVYDEHKSAGWAWSDAVRSVAASYRELEDDYLRARAADVEEVGQRVLVHLAGGAGAVLLPPSDSAILAAAELTVGDVMALDRTKVRAVATARGGATSHFALLARSAGIPTVVGLGDDLLAVAAGTTVIVDGDAGVLVVDPPASTVDDYTRTMERRAAKADEVRVAASQPAVTVDGTHIEVSANAMSVGEVGSAVAAGADGVGLFRVEYLFMDRTAAPTEAELFEMLNSAAKVLDGRPFTVRTLDAGADKPVPYLEQAAEANPFLGERGIRLLLAHPDLLDLQCRVMCRLAVEHRVRIMFPMVSTISEFRRALERVEHHRQLLADQGGKVNDLEIGVMVEVPSVALQAATFAAEVDFFSIGTNDLVQYTMAAERNNERMADLADPLHPSVLRLIRLVCDAAADRDRWVGVCGDLAGDTDATALLIGMGVRELSVSPPSIPVVKEAVRWTELDDARALASEALEMESAAAVRERCRKS